MFRKCAVIDLYFVVKNSDTTITGKIHRLIGTHFPIKIIRVFIAGLQYAIYRIFDKYVFVILVVIFYLYCMVAFVFHYNGSGALI